MAQGQLEQDPQTAATSQTTTQPSQPETREGAPRVLRLRGAHTTNRRAVQWADDVVDNEGLGRKSSKVCCIYHKPKAVGESSDESSSDSSSGDDSDSDVDNKRKTGDAKQDCGHSHGHRHGRSSKERKKKRSPSPNAYEKVPKYKPKQEELDKTKA